MEILYMLIFISMMMALGALAAFIWATKSGQFNDLQRPAEQMLVDDAADET